MVETPQEGGRGKMSEQVLKVENVTMQFGGVVAVNNLSMLVQKTLLIIVEALESDI